MASPTSTGSGSRSWLPPLAAHHDFAPAPVDVIEPERGHLPGPQPEAPQHGEDGEVTQSRHRAPVAAGEQRSHRLCAQTPRQWLVRPTGGSGHRLRHRAGRVALQEQEAQQRPQRRDQHPGRPGTPSLTLADHEGGHVPGPQAPQVQPIRPLALRQEQPGRAQVALDTARRQPPFARQVAAVLLQQHLRGRAMRRLRRDRSHPQAAQVSQQRQHPSLRQRQRVTLMGTSGSPVRGGMPGAGDLSPVAAGG